MYKFTNHNQCSLYSTFTKSYVIHVSGTNARSGRNILNNKMNGCFEMKQHLAFINIGLVRVGGLGGYAVDYDSTVTIQFVHSVNCFDM